jgi:rare lipoprotein A
LAEPRFGKSRKAPIFKHMVSPLLRNATLLFCLGVVTLAMTIAPPAQGEEQSPVSEGLTGYASWYGGKFHGRLTASGEVFDTNELTAAHRTLPFGSVVRVTNRDNEKQVIVRINDRGPFVEGRVIDLSRAAADILGITAVGIAPVSIEVLHLQSETKLRTIQIGAYSERENAEAVARSLQDAGLGAVIETSNGGINRVIIQGVSLEEIPDYEARLARLGYRNVLVRQK